MKGANTFGDTEICLQKLDVSMMSPSGATALTFRKDPQALKLLLGLSNKLETRLRFPPVPVEDFCKGESSAQRTPLLGST